MLNLLVPFLISSTTIAQIPQAPEKEKQAIYSMLAEADALKNSRQYQKAIDKVKAALAADTKVHALQPIGLALANSLMGDCYLELNQPQKALPLFELALKGLDGPYKLHVLYNMACAESLAKNTGKSFLYLRSTLELAKNHPEHLKKYTTIAQTEPQLKNLRAQPDFKKLMAQYPH